MQMLHLIPYIVSYGEPPFFLKCLSYRWGKAVSGFASSVGPNKVHFLLFLSQSARHSLYFIKLAASLSLATSILDKP